MTPLSPRQWRIVDLSMPLPSAVATFPGDTPLQISGPHSAVIGERREYCYDILLSTQTGTHVQGGHYFDERGRRIHDYPLERFIAPILLLDVSQRVIDLEDVRPSLEMDLRGYCVLFRTGYSRMLSRRAVTALSIHDIADKPGLTVAAATWLIRNGLQMIGIDAPGVELYPTTDHRVNVLLGQADVLIVENLVNLDALSREHKSWIECLPLPVYGVEGTPCRAIARVNL